LVVRTGPEDGVPRFARPWRPTTHARHPIGYRLPMFGIATADASA
jgi:hypothetical protein